MGVLPLTVETLTKRLGVNATTANTVASFGTTAGMQGCAGVFPALVVVYISNVANIPFDLTHVHHECYRYRYRFRWYCWCSWYSLQWLHPYPLVVQALVRTSHPSAQFLQSIH